MTILDLVEDSTQSVWNVCRTLKAVCSRRKQCCSELKQCWNKIVQNDLGTGIGTTVGYIGMIEYRIFCRNKSSIWLDYI